MKHTEIRFERRWGLLASAIRTRMAELEFNEDGLAERSGVSAAVIGDIASGTPKNYRPNTLIAVAQGLDWHPLAPIAVLAGDEAAASIGIHLPSGRPAHNETTTEHGHMAAAA